MKIWIIVTKSFNLQLEVDKGEVEDQSSDDKQKGVEQLNLWVLYDWSNHKVYRNQNKQNWYHDRNLQQKQRN
jgi:hypothetical protein